MKAYSTASFKVASQIVPEGRTTPFIFNMTIPCDGESTCYIYVDSDYAQQLKNSYLIVWDEICMSHRNSITAVDRLFPHLINYSCISFRGNCVLLFGDFHQILTIIPDGSRLKIAADCLKSSPLYPHFKIMN